MDRSLRYSPPRGQTHYATYNAYGQHSVIAPNQAHPDYHTLAIMRTNAILDKQVQVKELSHRFRKIVAQQELRGINGKSKSRQSSPPTQHSSVSKNLTPSEMDKALKDKLSQTGNGLKPKLFTEKGKPDRVGVIGQKPKRL